MSRFNDALPTANQLSQFVCRDSNFSTIVELLEKVAVTLARGGVTSEQVDKLNTKVGTLEQLLNAEVRKGEELRMAMKARSGDVVQSSSD